MQNILETLPCGTSNQRFADPQKMSGAVGIEAWDSAYSKYVEQVQELSRRRAAHTAARTAVQQSDQTHRRALLDAVREGKAEPPDPIQKLTEKEQKALRAVELQEAVVVPLSDELFELRERLAPQFLFLAKEQRAAAIAALELGLHGQQQAWADLGEAQWLQMWGAGSRKPSRSVAGVEHLNKLERVINEMAHPTRTIYVTSAALAALKRGETVEDVKGATVTPEDCEDAIVRVGRSKPLPRSSTGFGDLA